MSVAKLRKSTTPFTVVTNRVINAIDQAEALALFVYLQSKPDGWTIRQTDIRRKFGWGRDRYLKAMACLRSVGLVELVPVQDDETGRMGGRDIVLHADIPDTIDGEENPRSENPIIGKTAPLEKKDSLEKKEELENPHSPPMGDEISATRSAVLEAFDYWVSAMGKREGSTVLDRGRKKRIEWAIKTYGLDQVKAAIDGCRSSAFHMGDNPSGKRYDDIKLICRDAEKFESFLAGGGRGQDDGADMEDVVIGGHH